MYHDWDAFAIWRAGSPRRHASGGVTQLPITSPRMV